MSFHFTDAETIHQLVESLLDQLAPALDASSALVLHGDEASLVPTVQGMLALDEPPGEYELQELLVRVGEQPQADSFGTDLLPSPLTYALPLRSDGQHLGAIFLGSEQQLGLATLEQLRVVYTDRLAYLLQEFLEEEPESIESLLDQVPDEPDEEPRAHRLELNWTSEKQTVEIEIPRAVTNRVLVDWL